MKKVFCWLMVAGMIIYGIGLLRDMEMLHRNMIRLHVVGASDEEKDQELKLQVKDAVNAFIRENMENPRSFDRAKEMLAGMLPQLHDLVRQVLAEHGSNDSVEITLEQEPFPRREYETFTLPAGVYESLRIRIGAAEGRNWWCVVFPSLCGPYAEEDLRETAVGAGFSEELCDTITGEEGLEIRFFLLDFFGQIQNLWFGKN